MKLRVRLFGKNIFVAGSKYEDKINYSDYYPLSVICKNCNKFTQVFIKKGVHVNDVINNARCSYCSVRLEKQEK